MRKSISLNWLRLSFSLLLFLTFYNANSQLNHNGRIEISLAPTEIGQKICVTNQTIPTSGFDPDTWQVMWYQTWINSDGQTVRDMAFGTCDDPLIYQSKCFTLEAKSVHIHRCIRPKPPCDQFASTPSTGPYVWRKAGYVEFCLVDTVVINADTIYQIDTIYQTQVDTIVQTQTLRDTIIITQVETDTIVVTDTISQTDTIWIQNNDLVFELTELLSECRDSLALSNTVSDACSEVYLEDILVCSVFATPNPVGKDQEFQVVVESTIGGENLLVQIFDVNNNLVRQGSSFDIENLTFSIENTGIYFGVATFDAIGYQWTANFKIVVQ